MAELTFTGSPNTGPEYVSSARPLPVTGSFTSSTVATASAIPTTVVAGVNKPLNIDLHSSLFTTVTDGAGNIISPITIGGRVASAGRTYITVAASQTNQLLGATGAIGDTLDGLIIIPATTSPGNIIVLDGATSTTVFTGGASSVANLVSFYIPMNSALSKNAGWYITTGANVSAIAVGKFTSSTILFGSKTRAGHGGVITSETPSSVLTGTGSADWVIDTHGNLAPAGTFNSVVTFSRSSYSLTGASGQHYNISIVNNTAHCKWIDSGINADNTVSPGAGAGITQLRTILSTGPTSSGAMVLGDTIVYRDGLLGAGGFNPTAADVRVRPPAGGYAGGGTITGGSSYTNGTYTNVSLTGGSGIGALANIVVAGAVVTSVHIQNPGSGYLAGDVLSAAAADIGGTGSGFAYTVINLARRIAIQSETSNNTIDANGNSVRGGGLQVGAIVWDGATSGDILFPFDLKNLWFYNNTDALQARPFCSYAVPTVGYGISAYQCRFENSDAVSLAHSNFDNFDNRGGVMTQCYIRRVRRGCTGGRQSGDLQSVVTFNIFEQMVSDGLTISGQNWKIEDNFFFNFQFLSGGHPDTVQHLGTLSTINNFGSIQRNISVRNVGPVGIQDAQGIFLAGTTGSPRLLGATVQNNICILTLTQGLSLTNFTSANAKYNTILTALNSGVGTLGLMTMIDTNGVTNTFDRNIASGKSLSGAIDTNNIIVGDSSLATYHAALPNYIDGVNPGYVNRALVIAALGAGLTGTAALGDGTFAGALFPDLSWNNGAVYVPGSLPPAT